MFLLLRCETEQKVFAAAEDVIEVLVVFSEGTEVVIEGAVNGVVKNIVPDNTGVQCVKCEATEKAVLGIGDEVEDLMWGAGQEGGDTQGRRRNEKARNPDCNGPCNPARHRAGDKSNV